ncbi:MAG: sporulation protein YabP [Heliobacteriaceae bacterium]|nr:sporulation protein YabP [Heliobacteriaceae bacterium]MDD4587652.1 sporulation protein YabP [Heliobacteriaceae bacterium]
MEVRQEKPHGMEITERRRIRIRGVTQVGAFDEAEVFMVTVQGPLLLKGEGLHINQLNLDEGIVAVEGLIHAVQYLPEASTKTFKQKGKSIIGRLLK